MSEISANPDPDLAAPASGEYHLRLYISGLTPNSRKAVENIKTICEEYLPGRYKLEVVDIYQQPELAAAEQVVAVPMLIRMFPGARRLLIGDMSDTNKVLKGLDLLEL